MGFTVLDLEWNSAYYQKMEKYVNEIIQFGAVRAGSSLVAEETYNQFVRPQIGKKLSARVEQLTNISAEELERGVPFLKALQNFCRWLEKDGVLMTWGPCDIRELIENFKAYTQQIELPFTGRYLDLQAYCQECLELPASKQIGLSAAADLLGVDYAGLELHRAVEDSVLALRCFQKLYRPELVDRLAVEINRSFFEKMIFKTSFLTDLNHPLVDKAQMAFRCPDCGRRMKRLTGWTVKNKQFFARFQCRRCGVPFVGRVQFKQRYEGVAVKKALAPYVTEPEKPPEAGAADC